VALSADTIRVDSLSIIPGSLTIRSAEGNMIDSSLFLVSYVKAEIFPTKKLLLSHDSLYFEYRVFPLLLEGQFAKRKYAESLSPDSLLGRYAVSPGLQNEQESPFGDQIQTNGSMARGIRFGNTQGLSVNSTLNMTFGGELNNGLMIEGAISDQSIPLQPDGTTHRLEEFDRIFLKVHRKGFAIQAGDIDLSTGGNGELLTFNRKVQGLAYQGKFTDDEDTLSVTAAFAVPKGKFVRNQIQGIEGNQGPYRLRGNSGEPYIIILSGTERVYVDGSLLQRGEDFHYTIDYNSAELTFTHRMPINSNSRVVVEFEYSERSYARFNTFANVEGQKGKWHWTMSVFSEHDSRNQPFDQELTDEQKEHLASIGDNEELAFYPQADSVEFDPERILYQKLDTLVESVTYSIFRYSTNPEHAAYRVFFSFVGEGNGNYIPDFGSANGRVYRWVAPENDVPQGSYEPVRRLVAPQKRQMVHAGVSHRWENGSSIAGSYALSNTDLNTFSNLDVNDNIGHAFLLSYNQNINLSNQKAKAKIGASALKTSNGFRSIDRFRPVEFERDWSISQPLNAGSEQHLNFWTSIEQSKRLFAEVKAENFTVANWYKGTRVSTNSWAKLGWFGSSFSGSMVQSSDTAVSSRFYKARGTLSGDINLLKLSVAGEMESLNSTNESTGLAMPQSFEWYQVKSMLSLPDSLSVNASVYHIYREDYKFFNGIKTLAAGSHEVNGTLAANLEKVGNFSGSFGFRKTDVNQNIVESVQNNRSALARIDYSNRFFKGFWSVAGGYELSSGLEPDMEYYFVEVPAGQGVYTWVDYNGNGVMELDEFEVANYPDEARFIRINFPGTKMISVRTNSIRLSSIISPSRIIKTDKGFAKHLARLSAQTAYRAQQKNQYNSFRQYANPFTTDIHDSLLTSMSANFRTSLAYNRSSQAFGLEYVYVQGVSKTILANGFEQKDQQSQKLTAWVGLGELFSVYTEADIYTTIASSEYFQLRNYLLNGEAAKLTLKFISSKQHRAELGARYNQSANDLANEELKTMDYFFQADLIFSGRGSLMAKTSLVDNTFKGEAQTAVAYEMMKGLQPGRNVTWEVTLRHRLSKLFEIELGYNGRYLGDGSIVHSGSMMARALF